MLRLPSRMSRKSPAAPSSPLVTGPSASRRCSVESSFQVPLSRSAAWAMLQAVLAMHFPLMQVLPLGQSGLLMQPPVGGLPPGTQAPATQTKLGGQAELSDAGGGQLGALAADADIARVAAQPLDGIAGLAGRLQALARRDLADGGRRALGVARAAGRRRGGRRRLADGVLAAIAERAVGRPRARLGVALARCAASPRRRRCRPWRRVTCSSGMGALPVATITVASPAALVVDLAGSPRRRRCRRLSRSSVSPLLPRPRLKLTSSPTSLALPLVVTCSACTTTGTLTLVKVS